MDTRVASLERNIHFLKQVHKETLGQLHGEIERLKRQNKELQFKLIMEPVMLCGNGSINKGQQYSAQGHTLQCGSHHEQKVADTCLLPQDTNLRQTTHGPEASRTSKHSAAASTEPAPEAKGSLISSLVPLQILQGSSQAPRAPTLQECEFIVRQLYNANSLQYKEILCLKAVLRDIVVNKKINPENYNLTKAYLVAEKRVEQEDRFPKLPFCTLQKRRPLCQASLPERVILPALKQSLSSSFPERQRRIRAVQRSRFRRAAT